MGKKRLIAKKFILSVGVIAAVMLICSIFTVGTLAAGDTNEILSAELNKKLTDITFDIRLTKDYVKENKSETLYLFEFLPYQSTSEVTAMEPVKSFKVNSKISFKLSYIDGNATRLYSKFAVAEINDDGAYSLITPAVYIGNVEAAAKNTEPYPEKSSVKGLQIGSFSDAQQLGISHTVLNIPVNEYLLGESSENALSFHYNGQTYYLDKNKVALLDHKVKTYTEAGINVYFNIILTKPAAGTHESVLALYNDGISPDAALYAFNTRSESGMKMFRAFMDYISARYTDPAHTYGFVPAMILGFEVNSNTVWNNVGTADLSGYVYSYCTAFRVVYTAMRSNYSEGRVYISVGNNWKHVDFPEADFPAKDFIDVFASATKSSGDIPWGVSINPYSSESEMAEFWNDTKAKSDFETPYITMKNLSTFTEYMSRDAVLYNGETRSIMIGEWAVSGDPADSRRMDLQAASYALAYYTAAMNDHIDAFIYKRQVDYPVENAFWGLSACKDGTIGEPGAKKPVYNIFATIDTAAGADSAAFIRETVGSGVFSIVMGDNVDFKDFEDRISLTSETVTEKQYKKGTKTRTLFDLGGGTLYSFYPSDGAEFVELREVEGESDTALYARVTDIPTSYKGIGSVISADEALKGARYITVRVMANAPEGIENVNLALRLASHSGISAEISGVTALTPGEWKDVTFDIRQLVKLTDGDIDMMKLWMSVDPAAAVQGEYGLWLDSVTLHVGKGVPVIVWILLALLMLVLLAVAAYGVLYIRAQLIRKKRREERRRREEQARRIAMQQGRMNNPPNNYYRQ